MEKVYKLLQYSENYTELLKDLNFHFMAYRDKVIDKDDLIQALEEVLNINLDKVESNEA